MKQLRKTEETGRRETEGEREGVKLEEVDGKELRRIGSRGQDGGGLEVSCSCFTLLY